MNRKNSQTWQVLLLLSMSLTSCSNVEIGASIVIPLLILVVYILRAKPFVYKDTDGYYKASDPTDQKTYDQAAGDNLTKKGLF